MVKNIILFIANNIGSLHTFNEKVEAAYDLWRTIYDKVKILFPPAAQAPVAPAPTAYSAPAAADGPPAEPNDTDFMRASGLIE